MKYFVMLLFGWTVSAIMGFIFHAPPIATAATGFFSPFFAKYIYETFFELK